MLRGKKTQPLSYKAALQLDCTDSASNVNAMKKLTTLRYQKGSNLPDFDCKSTKDGTINVLFKSYTDAMNTKKILDEKIENLTVKDPVRKNIKKIDLVGLPFSVT